MTCLDDAPHLKISAKQGLQMTTLVSLSDMVKYFHTTDLIAGVMAGIHTLIECIIIDMVDWIFLQLKLQTLQQLQTIITIIKHL